MLDKKLKAQLYYLVGLVYYYLYNQTKAWDYYYQAERLDMDTALSLDESPLRLIHRLVRRGNKNNPDWQ